MTFVLDKIGRKLIASSVADNRSRPLYVAWHLNRISENGPSLYPTDGITIVCVRNLPNAVKIGTWTHEKSRHSTGSLIKGESILADRT